MMRRTDCCHVWTPDFPDPTKMRHTAECTHAEAVQVFCPLCDWTSDLRQASHQHEALQAYGLHYTAAHGKEPMPVVEFYSFEEDGSSGLLRQW